MTTRSGGRGPPAAIQDPRPENALGLGRVVADMQDGVGDVKVPVGAGIPVAPERLDQRQRRRRRAETRIAIHVRGTEAGIADEREGVILLKKQLPRVVDPDTARARP
jgi:hypothetical protein